MRDSLLEREPVEVVRDSHGDRAGRVRHDRDRTGRQVLDQRRRDRSSVGVDEPEAFEAGREDLAAGPKREERCTVDADVGLSGTRRRARVARPPGSVDHRRTDERDDQDTRDEERPPRILFSPRTAY